MMNLNLLTVCLLIAPVLCIAEQENDPQGEAEQNVEQRNIEPSHAYTVLGTVVIDGKTYVLLRNPWGKVEPVEDGSPRQQSQTKPTYVKRGSGLAKKSTDTESIERALAYCKAEEQTSKMCGFTSAPACPEKWTIGKTFVVSGKTYTACVKSKAAARQ